MSSSMRKVKLVKDTTTILKQQTSKLQQKLSLLRSQVTQKKRQKQMNMTSTSSFRNTAKGEFSKKDVSDKQYNQSIGNSKKQQPKNNKMQISLKQKLRQLKLQGLQQKLKQKGVLSINKLVSISQQQIDQWKDIAVGWRIKLKKFVKTLSLSSSSSDNNNNSQLINNQTKQQYQKVSNTNNYQQQNQQHTKKRLNQSSKSNRTINEQFKVDNNELVNKTTNIIKDRDIEGIIQRRNQVKVFVPLNRQYQQQEDNQEEYRGDYEMKGRTGLLTEDDEQDRLIDKLMKAFQPRKSILVKQSKILLSSLTQKQPVKKAQIINNKNLMSKDKLISWSQSVQQLQQQFLSKSHKTYPKQAIVKQALIQMHNNQTTNLSTTQISLQQQNRSLTFSNSNSHNNFNQVKYCWRCFNKIIGVNINNSSEKLLTSISSGDNNNNININKDKCFCSIQCLEMYKSQSEMFSKLGQYENEHSGEQQQQQCYQL